MSTWLTQQQLYARVASIVACALVASACDLGKHTHSHTTEREVGSVLPDAARGHGGSRARIGNVSGHPRNFSKVAHAKRWAGQVGLSGWPVGRLAAWPTGQLAQRAAARQRGRATVDRATARDMSIGATLRCASFHMLVCSESSQSTLATTAQMADLLTKPLDADADHRHRSRLMNLSA